jgi:hypothetical protein
MAVHCSVCGTRLYDATENDGSFSVTKDFTGWNEDGLHPPRPRIQDTCSSCAGVLREAVTRAANAIVEHHRPAVEKLRAEVRTQRERQAKFERDKIQFEHDWHAKNAGR